MNGFANFVFLLLFSSLNRRDENLLLLWVGINGRPSFNKGLLLDNVQVEDLPVLRV